MQPQQPYQSGPPPGYAPQPMQMPQTAAQLKPRKPVGLIIVVILLILLLFASGAYGYSMMSSRNDYRDNVQEKIDAAVAVAIDEREKELSIEFAEREKTPLVNYTGPSEFGTVSIDYPKTWSAYVDESKSGSTPVDGYFHPSFVPGTNSGTSFALRLEVLEKTYDKELSQYASGVKRGEVRVAPIKLEKVPSVAGSRIDGEVERDKQGSVVLFPLRDKTIKISVLTDTFVDDFNNIILKNMSFQP